LTDNGKCDSKFLNTDLRLPCIWGFSKPRVGNSNCYRDSVHQPNAIEKSEVGKGMGLRQLTT